MFRRIGIALVLMGWVVDDLKRVLRKVKPAVIIAPHPQLDSHRDHQFTTIAQQES